jgi:hypothetical protein
VVEEGISLTTISLSRGINPWFHYILARGVDKFFQILVRLRIFTRQIENNSGTGEE